jgi:hypothetical protein
MADEGIMALPQGMGMQDPETQQPRPTVTSADSYDAAQTALGMVNPQEQAALTEAIRQNIGDLQATPQQLDMLIQALEYVSQNPGEYKNLLQKMIETGALDKGDMPAEYDPEFLGAMLAVLQEMRQMQGAGAQEPMNLSPVVEGLQPMGMASGGLADVGQYLASKGRGGDSILAHITPGEAALLKRRGGSGTINPATGLPEFKDDPISGLFKAVGEVFQGVVDVAKDILKSPVGRILGTVALATVLGPAGIGLSLGSTAASSAAINMGLAGAGTTLLGGGNIKDALVSGAMGYIGGGGTIMGANPVAAVGGYLPGAAGSALNSGLATGVIGAGIGKISGMSNEDALRMGVTSGASAAALQGLQNMNAGQPPVEGQAQTRAAPQADGAVQSGDIGPTGAVGTAKDLLASQSAPGGSMPADYQAQFYKDIGIDPRSMSPTSVGASPSNIQIERNYLGMTGFGDTARQLMKEPINVAKDIYDTNLSPSRAGLPKDAGIFQKYGPLALAGTAAMAATGGMEGEPANQNPLFSRSYTGSDYMRDNPELFGGGLSSYTKPAAPRNPIVPAPSYDTIPVTPPTTAIPTGVTRTPGGVAQPYNVAGLYGVPLIYGPDGQPRRMARGGDAQMTNFPRKNGPINGPGTGTSDDIPAMLSDGEFVFTAKAVRNAGGGSRRKGAARMYKLMKKLEGGAVKGK